MTSLGDTQPLAYVVTTEPYPLRASQSEGTPNRVTLKVMITNATLRNHAVNKISITIPVGQNVAADLSPDRDLPQPVFERGGDMWKAGASGSVIRMLNKSEKAFSPVDVVIFELPDIAVGQVPGVVEVTFAALDSKHGQHTVTQDLVKLEADCPVERFYAKPDAVHDTNEPVTLYWKCSVQGTDYGYSVHTDTWRPKDCVQGGDCFTCQDGEKGVPSPPLTQTTEFALDIIEADPSGHRTIKETLRIEVPSIVPAFFNAYDVASHSGHFAQAYWVLKGANHCVVDINGKTMDETAPADPDDLGYSMVSTTKAGEHWTPTLTARSESGETVVTKNLEPVSAGAPRPVSVNYNVQDFAVTADGKWAVCVCPMEMVVARVDLNDPPATPVQVFRPGMFHSVSISPDGQTAALDAGIELISILRLSNGAVLRQIPLSGSNFGSTWTPDGKLILVGSTGPNCLRKVDPATGAVTATYDLPGSAGRPVVTLDGLKAVVPLFDAKKLCVVDLATGAVTSTTVSEPCDVAVSPDGKLAVTTARTATPFPFVEIVDLVAGKVLASLMAPSGDGAGLSSVALTPDGRYAILSALNGAMSVVDVAARKFLPGSIPNATSGSIGVAALSDGSIRVVTGGNRDNATQYVSVY